MKSLLIVLMSMSKGDQRGSVYEGDTQDYCAE